MAVPPQVPRRRARPGFVRRRTPVVRLSGSGPQRPPQVIIRRRVAPPVRIRRTRGAQVPLPPTGPYRPSVASRRRLWLPARRGRTVQVPLTQTATVVVQAFVPSIRRRTLRGFTRRGRVVSVPLAVVTTVPHQPARLSRRLLPQRRRTQPTVPPTVIVTVVTSVPAIPRPRRGIAWTRRRTSPTVTMTIEIPFVPVVVPRFTLLKSEDAKHAAAGQVTKVYRPTQRRFPH